MSSCLARYGDRPHTRTDHLQDILSYLGYRRATSTDLEALEHWLTERALEHDKPTLLFQMACDRLRALQIFRPGLSILERIVTAARQAAQTETYRQLQPLIRPEYLDILDGLLEPDPASGRTLLFWLRHGATANTPAVILSTIAKLEFLYAAGVPQWDMGMINPNRRKFLAQLGRRSSNQALQRMTPERRYPILLSFLWQSLEDITDELLDLFDRCLADCYARSRRNLQTYHLSAVQTTQDKLRLLHRIGQLVLDDTIPNDRLREMIYEQIPQESLRTSMDECDQLLQHPPDKPYAYFVQRFAYLRVFTPRFFEVLDFQASAPFVPLLQAIQTLKALNESGKRIVPQEAPLDFVPQAWLPYVQDDHGRIIRRYYEMCTLWELRGALRSGDIWVRHSRRYADPETYLIPQDLWPTMRPEACRILNLPEQGIERIEKRQDELETIFDELDHAVTTHEAVRIEQDRVVLTPLKVETLPERVQALQSVITERLPRVDLTDLLIEVDYWTRFSDAFEHAGQSQPRSPQLLRHLYASLLANACNFGLPTMAEIADLTYQQLAWCANWYLREETLQAAINTLVDYHYNQPLSRSWGGGTMSSSDGQRFPVSVSARHATALPRYFGYGQGLTFYSWTSDQFSQYGSKVIPATVRDATYVLDAILDNETELPILEHTTDTTGYTELVFALFDLLGLQFSPRIRDLGDQRLYRIDKKRTYRHIEPILKGRIHIERFLNRWDDLLRVAASIRLGWVTASLLISKLQAYPRQNALTTSLQEYGRLIKSIYIPTYICREDQQRRVSLQLNKGESLHGLRSFLCFGNEGNLRKAQMEDQINQASALTLVTNAVIVWNTRYIQAILDQLGAEGYPIREEDLAHISPCRFEHINKYGKYRFNVEREWNRTRLRPLREPVKGVPATLDEVPNMREASLP